MFHYARRARSRTLFHDWTEATLLWRAVTSRVPGIVALTLMPDHLHLLSRGRVDRALGDALRAFALSRNRRRGESGRVFAEDDGPVEAKGRVKQRRDVRYIALNPCRARIVNDPLAWPFSTHRDAVGLAVEPVRAAAADPHALHHFVSGDPSVRVGGTELPVERLWRSAGPPVEVVRSAVSALTRTTLDGLERRGPARTLLIRSAVSLCAGSDRELGAALGCGRTTLHRARRARDRRVRLVAQVAGDPRFFALRDGPWRASLR